MLLKLTEVNNDGSQAVMYIEHDAIKVIRYGGGDMSKFSLIEWSTSKDTAKSHSMYDNWRYTFVAESPNEVAEMKRKAKGCC